MGEVVRGLVKLVSLALILGSTVACGQRDPATPQPTSATPVGQAPTTQVVGVITRVLPTNVHREPTVMEMLVDSQTVSIEFDPSRDYGFPLQHLRDHQATGAPVRVLVEDRAGLLIAMSVEDV